MLVRITNRCRMGCRHCLVDGSSRDGAHMSTSVFSDCLRFARRVSEPLILISGGEPFEHPSVFSFAERARLEGLLVVVLSNGMFSLDAKMLEKVKASNLAIQVTNDSRYYPFDIDEEALNSVSGVKLERSLRVIFPCARVAKNGIITSHVSPPCFNLRYAVRQLKNLKLARLSLVAHGFFCTPSVNVDGSIRLGESDTCCRVGNVKDSPNKILCGILEARCNRCGLAKNLSDRQQAALGGAL